ncbi:MAG: PspC domain-containing protein [Anaerolineae bacterium]|nr:PspC domain-containing protein [Anaerolineae bacterium]
MTEKRFTRSSSDKMIFGVCGGLANYFQIDPTIVRMVFALLFLMEGVGLFAYIILAIVMPEDTAPVANTGSNGREAKEKSEPQFEPLGSREN